MLTDVTIQKANPGISKRTGEKICKETPDGKITGLYLVVQPSGA